MNFIKRAFFSMKTRIGRTALQLIIFTIVSVLILSGFTIQSAANKASEMAKEQLGGTVTLTVDREKQMKRQQSEQNNSNASEKTRPSFQSTPISLANAESLAKLDHVASYNYYSSTQALAKDFDPVKSEGDSSTDTDESGALSNEMPQMSVEGSNRQMTQADLSISGVLDSKTATDFSGGTSVLKSGRALTSHDTGKKVVLVEQTLADQNDWQVGDKISVVSSDEETAVELEIVGIYKTSDSGSDMASNFSFLNPYNKMYVPYEVANTLKGSDYKNTVDSAVYTMDDASNIASFEKQAKKIDSVDWDTFKLDANDTLYQQMIGPINNVASFSKNVVYIVTIAGALILALLIMMQVRERKYEMGVLLAIGESRMKLVLQFFTEILMVAVMSFMLAGLSSHYVAQIAGNQLLSQQNEAAQTTSANGQNENGGPGGSNGQAGPRDRMQNGISSLTQNTEEIKKLDIQVTLADMLKMGGIGVGIAFISVLLPAMTILRMNPKTILTKQE
ncbi:ABC transporter permease [Listeria fleischmannii]|uniref:ABC transporter permease n=1 Tax=Listeria fleischmannii TaxID=1069827 RepID=A0A841YGL3_9LIST|nr:ABC transporter permease [Listeria fleischmannii]MBC1399238.1 ABC transporter permease [Listeria fleischmannii]MBC1427610.1 ABC transporter permease [Listeria fleischmannii]